MGRLSATVNLARSLKRRILTDGFARTVYDFLTEIKKPENFQYPRGKYLVNLSFDLELSLNTDFWERENIERAISLGQSARYNLCSIIEFLNSEAIPWNVQIVGALLDNISVLPLQQSFQVRLAAERPELFTLSPADISLLAAPNVEIGTHGFSHRRFTTLTAQEANKEIKKCCRLSQKYFGLIPSFMSFPRNDVAHSDIVQKHGINLWRISRQQTTAATEVPLGLWLAPGVLGNRDLIKLLDILRHSYPGFFLHLWGHFTEMNIETFRQLINTIKSADWDFITTRQYKQNHQKHNYL